VDLLTEAERARRAGRARRFAVNHSSENKEQA
jgi:hypothetical protein